MYVKELKENMLIIPKKGICWQFANARGDDGLLLLDNNISGTLMLHGGKGNIPGYKNLGQDPAVYLYCKNDGWMWGGVYRHHYVLISGQLCILDGYQFKDVKPLK
jgi:hypothetical protein